MKSRSEAEQELRDAFAALDQNGDGVVTLEAAALRPAERSCGRVHFFGGAVWGNFREIANCGDPVG